MAKNAVRLSLVMTRAELAIAKRHGRSVAHIVRKAIRLATATAGKEITIHDPTTGEKIRLLEI